MNVLASSNRCGAERIGSIHHSLHSTAWRRIAVGFVSLAVFTFMSAGAVAQQAKISIESFRVLNTTPDFVDIELVGSNDGSMRLLWLGAIAKSKDGTVRSEGFPSFIIPADRQFHILSRVQRPDGLRRQQTDVLMVMVYSDSKEIILKRRFDWPFVWPEKPVSTAGGEHENAESSAERPSKAFLGNLLDDDFGALDNLMRIWDTPKERDKNGEWKLDGFRRVFVNYSYKNRDWKLDYQRIKKWREFNPKSAGAAIAEARYWAAYAWHIRGSETSEEVDPVAIRVFGERMKRAEKVLMDSREFGADNPLWYETYLDIAVATKRDDRFVEGVFDEAIRKHPYFLPLYLDMARHWAPISGEKADWKRVDEVVNRAVTATKTIDGIGNYSLLYAQISDSQKFEFDIFQDSLVSWGKMQDSFEELMKRYPSADNLNMFAAFACRAGDKNAFLKIRAQIINRIVPNKWPGNYSFDLCDHRFMQKT